jgi:ParB family chromosome partitioning protein
VREAERLAQQPDAEPHKAERKPVAKSADVVALEKELSDQLGMKVELRDEGEGRGVVTVFYRSLEQLDHLCRKFRK